ncbi:tetratricopeptide repeat protein [Tenacibaculum sp. M341]|uniref:tetratricopeptide repeat protein n=1 Tax=Tenacibaculum sp. M341 TaxID=2530339 RepID=UPI001046A38F|nr:tetratricopeptide repeat protein [Tenacibaculum sp. M341]TCI94248.1 tetratricopeptide repeat protein [Tenacibaculum sp. M341]
MVRIFYLLVLFVLSSLNLNAQSANELFEQGNSQYKDGKYTEAIASYEKILSLDNVSAELYFNLGNCYYKLNKVAPSIYNYEKALKLDPSNSDAQNNLIFAKRLTLDRIDSLPKSLLQRFNENYISQFSYNQWGFITVLFSFITAILFLLYYFYSGSNKKRLFFTTSIISLLLLITSLSISFNQYTKSKNTIEAIVFNPEVSVKNEPTKDADEAFILHEGTKVLVLDKVDDWSKIRLSDGKIGWLKIDNIKIF